MCAKKLTAPRKHFQFKVIGEPFKFEYFKSQVLPTALPGGKDEAAYLGGYITRRKEAQVKYIMGLLTAGKALQEQIENLKETECFNWSAVWPYVELSKHPVYKNYTPKSDITNDCLPLHTDDVDVLLRVLSDLCYMIQDHLHAYTINRMYNKYSEDE